MHANRNQVQNEGKEKLLQATGLGKSFPQDTVMLKVYVNSRGVWHGREIHWESLSTLNHLWLRKFPKLKIASIWESIWGTHNIAVFLLFFLSVLWGWRKNTGLDGHLILAHFNCSNIFQLIDVASICLFLLLLSERLLFFPNNALQSISNRVEIWLWNTTVL